MDSRDRQTPAQQARPGERPVVDAGARPIDLAVQTARAALEAPGLPAPAPSRRTPGADALADFFYRPDEQLGEELADLVPESEEQAPTADEPLREFLGFELAGEHYAVELERIREIVKVYSITEVPRAPADVLGVTSVRGEVMPVFDLRRRLRLPRAEGEPERRARVVIVDIGDGSVGLLVDAVESVVRLRGSTIEAPPPGLGANVESEYLVGIGRVEDRMYVLLNLSTVLAGAGSRGGGR